MNRRRGLFDKDKDDDHQPIIDGKIDAPNDDEESRPRIKEEKHILPRPLNVFKKRISSGALSSSGKLLYWWITVVILGVIAFILVLAPLLIERGKRINCSDYNEADYEDDVPLPFFFKPDTGHFEICQKQRSVLRGVLGMDRSFESEDKVNVFTYSFDSKLNITSLPTKKNHCLQVQWVGMSSSEKPLQDCYSFDPNVYWYGAYEQDLQLWPLQPNNMQSFHFAPFLPFGTSPEANVTFGSILHPLWLNSEGVGIIIEENVELSISVNETSLCLSAQPFQLQCSLNSSIETALNYMVCVFDTVAQTAQYFLNESGLISRPSAIPEPSVFAEPMWSSSFDFNDNISTSSIVELCEGIKSNNFSLSQLVLGNNNKDIWLSKLDFDMLSRSHCGDFDLTLSVSLFVTLGSTHFQDGLRSNFFLPACNQLDTVILIRVGNVYGAILDIIKDAARGTYSDELLKLRNTSNLTSFHFDADYMPTCAFVTTKNHAANFIKAYVKFVTHQPYSSRAIVHVGYFTQGDPLFIRLGTITSTVDILKHTLNTVLSVGLAGYNFVVPNVINRTLIWSRNSSQLYIRWVQLNTFFPVMQFSIPPRQFNHSELQHMRSLTLIHNFFNFSMLAEESVLTGYPILRPLWWRASRYPNLPALNISDQFFIGDKYMVAPILEPGKTTRSVYFPVGARYELVHFSEFLTLPDFSSPLSPCTQNSCEGGSHTHFNVSLFQVLCFKIRNL